MASVNARLKELREAAYPPLSQRALAERVGLSKSAYHLYESEGPGAFKQRYLPMDLARRIASILADHNVSSEDVLALAGLEADEINGGGLTHSQEKWVDMHDAMSPAQRKLMEQLAEQILGRKAAETLNQPQDSYRSTGAPHS